jgi:hypothetical protein
MEQCPKCGGEIYDNRADKASGDKSHKWPDFKCKDADCGWAKWSDKGKGKGKGKDSGGTGAVEQARGPRYSWRQLAGLYAESLKIADHYVSEIAAKRNLPVTSADLLAATATIFITAARGGVKGVTDQPAKPKPAPKPAPKATPTDKEIDDELKDRDPVPALLDEEDDDLPF